MFKINEKVKEELFKQPYYAFLLDTAYKVLKKYVKPENMELNLYIDPEIEDYTLFVIRIRDEKYKNLSGIEKEDLEIELWEEIEKESNKSKFTKPLEISKLKVEIE
jgi:hypothetical protein